MPPVETTTRKQLNPITEVDPGAEGHLSPEIEMVADHHQETELEEILPTGMRQSPKLGWQAQRLQDLWNA